MTFRDRRWGGAEDGSSVSVDLPEFSGRVLLEKSGHGSEKNGRKEHTTNLRISGKYGNYGGGGSSEGTGDVLLSVNVSEGTVKPGETVKLMLF